MASFLINNEAIKIRQYWGRIIK